MTRVTHVAHTTFRSLRSRNYRLYTVGQGVSLAGTWMQTVALGWLVLQLTGSGTSVGLVTAAQFIPVLLLAPLGGVFIDRVETRRVLICTQGTSAILALGLGLLTISGDVRLWMVYAVRKLPGVVAGGRQSGPTVVLAATRRSRAFDQRHHAQHCQHEPARVVGPAIGAVIISTIGVGPCFVVNAAHSVRHRSPVAMRSWSSTQGAGASG